MNPIAALIVVVLAVLVAFYVAPPFGTLGVQQ